MGENIAIFVIVNFIVNLYLFFMFRTQQGDIR